MMCYILILELAVNLKILKKLLTHMNFLNGQNILSWGYYG